MGVPHPGSLTGDLCRRYRAHMALTPIHITVDSNDVAAVAGFWSAALQRPVDSQSEEVAEIPGGGTGSIGWLFIKVPEGKAAKIRLHIDFGTADREAEVARLLALGARRIGDYDEWGAVWTTLADVEGNEFCVVQRS